MITKETLLHQLKAFGAEKGKPVIVHTALRAVGKIEGGGETLLGALIDVFTKDGGLLIIPTHTWDRDVYDRREAYSCIGTLPCLAAAHPEGVRTKHPTHSVTVFGEGAAEFARLDDNTDTPANPKGCLGKLYEMDGYVLLIGIGQEKNTYLHCAEEMLSVPGRLTDYKVEKTVIHKSGREEKRHLYWFDETIGDVSVRFPKFEAPFRHHGCISDGTVGNAPAQFCSAWKMKAVLETIYKNNNFKELLADDSPIDEALYK